MRCKIKKGIFVKKECGEKATLKCSVCGEVVCKDHISQEHSNRIVCVNCAAKDFANDTRYKSGKGGKIGNNHFHNHTDHMMWYMMYRDDFNSQYGETSAFVENDYENFDNTNLDENSADFSGNNDDFFDS